MLSHILARQLDEVRPDAIADAARPAVQHEPHDVGLVETHLDEVVAAAERPQVRDVIGARDLWMLGHDRVEAGLELGPRVALRHRRLVPRSAVAAAPGQPMRHRALDGRAHSVQVVGQVGRPEAGPHGHHAAADIDTDRRGNDRAQRRNHAADRRADAVVHVGHRGHPLVDEWQRGDVSKLSFGRLLERHAAGPRLDDTARVGGDDVVASLAHDVHPLISCPARGRCGTAPAPTGRQPRGVSDAGAVASTSRAGGVPRRKCRKTAHSRF